MLKRHLPQLDGLRAVAVLGVFSAHAGVQSLRGGGVGVQLFFALSGFLITSLLLKEQQETGGVALRLFYGRRALRLLPALFLVVLGMSAYGLATDTFRLPVTLSLLFYAINWVKAFQLADESFYGHMWSLAVEEQFYLLWPAVLVLVIRGRRRLALVLCIAGLVIPAVERLMIYGGPESLPRIFFGTDTVADCLLSGCLLAIALAEPQRRERVATVTRVLLLPCLAWLAYVVTGLPDLTRDGAELHFYATWGRSLEALSSAVVVGAATLSVTPLLRPLSSRALVTLGQVSYGFYLWHVPLLIVVEQELLVRQWLQVTVALVLTLAASWSSFVLVERPLQRRYRASLRSPDDLPGVKLPPAELPPEERWRPELDSREDTHHHS